jgi:UDP-glucuronate 4-epimerase
MRDGLRWLSWVEDRAGLQPRPDVSTGVWNLAPIIVTGAAGFVGSHLVRALLARGDEVVAVDSFNPFTPRQLQEDRIADWRRRPGVRFEAIDLADRAACAALFRTARPERVVHLAGQPSVRYALINPHAYVDNNVMAFTNVLEGARDAGASHLVFASTSAIYGANTKTPFHVDDPVDHPVSLYAATKKANELMAHAYAHSFGIPITGLRFFTVYGPWGRPDMATWTFTDSILSGRPIKVFNRGAMRRDFTYIDDIVEGVTRVLDRAAVADPAFDHAQPRPSRSSVPYRIYNIGNNRPVQLMHMISTLERLLGRPAIKELVPLPPGEVLETFADIDDLVNDVGFRPETEIETGLARFVDWYRDYHRLAA